MEVKEELLPNGWKAFTVENDSGMSIRALNYGGIITEINVPDRRGTIENVVLSYKKYEDYVEDPNYFGALIGRVAGRVDGASFLLNDEMYVLDTNDGDNSLHGGDQGFNKKIWNAAPFQTTSAAGVEFTLEIPDLEGGYPGSLSVKITYQLTNHNQFSIDYQAISDQDTAVTLTNHSYLNLSGNAKRTARDHKMKINSNQFVELDENLIPTGKIKSSEGTPFDLSKESTLQTGLDSSHPQIQLANDGFDHYFIFNETEEEQVSLKDEESGRALRVYTNQPGMVLYTGNNLNSEHLLESGPAQKHSGLCLETQASPASLHHKGFPSILLKANEPYEKKTTFTFETI
ncbi:aldose 1-epimerase [Halobacillus andaensis]|uniref:Aldose 1-epimerase n=1 Tax=Halobacillus andaensis TaxID=1176239 RepID=A0A917B9Q0_HALAA|nr:aldose epimerase family protein [Halobacillus andaensis]MBP2005259.1 aldose 1-epimerase [Halobacillus andaensis]GGF30076.1 aldose 1-epimerase [Halobacillus andaensis]